MNVYWMTGVSQINSYFPMREICCNLKVIKNSVYCVKLRFTTVLTNIRIGLSGRGSERKKFVNPAPINVVPVRWFFWIFDSFKTRPFRVLKYSVLDY